MTINFLRRIAAHLPGVKRIFADRDRLQNELGRLGHPPGHFYSPIPDLDEVNKRFAMLESQQVVEIPGVDLNIEEQERWVHTLAAYYPDQTFPKNKSKDHRYYFNNRMFRESDALFLYGLMRAVQPARVVEVGSGFSSAVMLDTNEKFLENAPSFTFIDPHPERLLGLLSDCEQKTVEIIDRRVQEATSRPWESLQSGDILFIDSSHVSKCGSDVNFLFNEVIPGLSDGVYVHVHDVSYPFEYPKSWLTERHWAWNEAYLLRAFLQFNMRFKIIAWVPFINLTMSELVTKQMPLCRNDHGGSFWMQKAHCDVSRWQT